MAAICSCILLAAISFTRAQDIISSDDNLVATIVGTAASTGFATSVRWTNITLPVNTIVGTAASTGFATSARSTNITLPVNTTSSTVEQPDLSSATSTVIITTASSNSHLSITETVDTEDQSVTATATDSSVTDDFTSAITKGDSSTATDATSATATADASLGESSPIATADVSPATTNKKTSSTATASATPTSDSSTTSAASPKPTTLTCPRSDGDIFKAPSGQEFVIECGTDHVGDYLKVVEVKNLRECIIACDKNKKCVDVSLTGSACYLKSVLGKAVKAKGVLGARSLRVTVPTPPISCPESDGTEYTTIGSNGNLTFKIECGVDYAGGDIRSVDVGSKSPNGNGDLWLQNCVEACGSEPKCIALALSGSACYLKSKVGVAGRNRGISGARLISSRSSTTATTAPAQPTSSCDVDYPLCPACNGTILYSEDSSPQQTYKVECGIDHAGGDIKSQAGAHTGMGGRRRYRNCLELCAEEIECVYATFQGSECFLKNKATGAVTYRDSAWSVRLV